MLWGEFRSPPTHTNPPARPLPAAGTVHRVRAASRYGRRRDFLTDCAAII